MKNMGKRIASKRDACGLTQEDLGKELDPPVTRQTISRWEQGAVADIKRSHIAQMAKIFNVDPVWLMGMETAQNVTLTYEAPNTETVKLSVDHQPIIGPTSKIAELYSLILAIDPKNYDLAIKILKSLVKEE